MNSVLIGLWIGIPLGIVLSFIIRKSALKKTREFLNKYRAFYWCLVKFLKIKQRGISLEKKLMDREIHSIAIYGMKELGELLYLELMDSEVDVKYAIDRDADYIYSELSLFKPSEKLESVDMVIVTVLSNNGKIIDLLKEMNEWEVVTLNTVLGWCDVES